VVNGLAQRDRHDAMINDRLTNDSDAFNPLTPICCHMVTVQVTTIKDTMPERVKSSFVIFDIRAL